MKRKLIWFLVAGLVFYLFSMQSVQAYSFTFDLDFVYSGTPPPSVGAPWARATFDDDIIADEVILTMQAFNLTGNEFISEWYFNFNPDKDINDLTIAGGNFSQVTDVDIAWAEDTYKAGGDGFYDIRFFFPPKTEESTSDRFSAGEMVTVAFSGLTDLVAGDFEFLSNGEHGDAGPFGSAAHIQAIGIDGEDSGEDSGWIADNPNPNPVPEPETMLLVGIGLIGLAGFGRRRFKA